uniref:TraB family protein n=1 Tax=uncultured marine group II/III euryarchaeote KM3_46_H05 TaxID=1456450 RepID=A0A075H8A1_9EURY|nr:TraB family protein [uncultured marine group II/III euryarchaeote KM3_46_H05]
MVDIPVVDVDENLRIVGTAHISSASADLVRQEIAEWKPDLVAVELCESRLKALRNPEAFDNEALSKVLKEGKTQLVLFQSLLATEQRRLGIEEGEKPGTDLLAAIEAAEEAGIEFELVDRDIQTTMRRAWRRMGLREKFRVINGLLLDGDQDDDEEIPSVDELLQNKDLITELLNELKEVAPGAGEVLIDERDEYLAGSIDRLRGRNPDGRILVVIGAGHLDAVAQKLAGPALENEDRLAELTEEPQPKKFWTVVKYGFPAAIILLFGYLLMQGNYEQLKEVALTWLALNASLAALGALLARGHPFAILTAAVASPITSLNPTLAAGWFAGYVQMKVAKPTTKDLQDFLKLDKFSLFWSNRVGRVLLVTALANLGSSAGAWFAGTAILGTLLS